MLHLPCLTVPPDMLLTLCCKNYIVWNCLKFKQVSWVLFNISFRSYFSGNYSSLLNSKYLFKINYITFVQKLWYEGYFYCPKLQIDSHGLFLHFQVAVLASFSSQYRLITSSSSSSSSDLSYLFFFSLTLLRLPHFQRQKVILILSLPVTSISWLSLSIYFLKL